MKKWTHGISLLMVLLLASCEQRQESLNKLNDNWFYLEGTKNETISDLIIDDFKSIDSLSQLEQYFIREEGYIWLKRDFRVPNYLKDKELALLLGRVTMADETYLNSEFLGSGGRFAPNFFSNWNEFRFFKIPQSILDKSGVNTLLVKIYVNGEGSITGDIILDEFEKVESRYKSADFFNSGINVIIASILLIMTAYYLFMFFMRRQEKANLYFALLSLATVIYLSNFFLFKLPGFDNWNLSYVTFQKVIFISVFASAYSFVSFVREFLNVKAETWQKRVVDAITIIPITFYLLIQDYKIVRATTNYIQLLLVVPLGLSLFYIIYSLVKKNRDTKILLIGISPFIITVLFDLIIHQILQYNTVIYLTGFGLPLFLISILFILSGRFVKYHNEVEELNQNLEQRVINRTNDLNLANNTLKETLDELQNKNEIIKRDMDMAKTIQSSLFPKNAPNTESWDTAFIFKPMSEVSGDLYDFYLKENELLGLTLLDVSGHGIASGLITMIANTISKRRFYSMGSQKLSKVIEAINSDLIREISDVENYLTGIFLRFNDNIVEYVNAGHADLIHKSFNTGKVTVVDNKEKNFKGWFLGIEDMQASYNTLKFKVKSNDLLFVYSDCLNESTNNAGEEYGVERILNTIETCPPGSADEMLTYIMERFYAFVQKDELSDDMTAILVKRN